VRYGWILVVFSVGCGSGRDAPPTDPNPPRRLTAREEAEQRCLAAIAVGGPATSGRDPLAKWSCGELYPDRTCGLAWELATGPTGDPFYIASACGDAYCSKLPAPRPVACDEALSGDRDALGRNAVVEELDRAILLADGTSLANAVAIAARAKRLPTPAARPVLPTAIPGVDPPIQMPSSSRIGVSERSLTLEGMPTTREELARHVRREVAADPDRTFLLSADADVPYARVVEVMDQIKDAGGKKIALTVP
jgi:hypothetical protein